MTSKRVKPVLQAPAITTTEQADAALGKIAAARREISRLELAYRENTAALKNQLAEDCEPWRQQVASLEQGLLLFATAQRDTLFSKRKSIALAFGTIGFRAASALATLKKSITWGAVLEKVKELGLDAIRVKEEVDKEKLKAMTPEKIASVGCKIVQSDDFFYELNEADGLPEPPEQPAQG